MFEEQKLALTSIEYTLKQFLADNLVNVAGTINHQSTIRFDKCDNPNIIEKLTTLFPEGTTFNDTTNTNCCYGMIVCLVNGVVVEIRIEELDNYYLLNYSLRVLQI